MLAREIIWKMMAQFVFAGMVTAAMAQTANGNKSTGDVRVILVMTDGLRWQEVFRGADKSLLVPARYYAGRSVDALKEAIPG